MNETELLQKAREEVLAYKGDDPDDPMLKLAKAIVLMALLPDDAFQKLTKHLQPAK